MVRNALSLGDTTGQPTGVFPSTNPAPYRPHHLPKMLEELEYFKRCSCSFLDGNEYWDDGANSSIPCSIQARTAHLDLLL
jgi:hypothetical protein